MNARKAMNDFQRYEYAHQKALIAARNAWNKGGNKYDMQDAAQVAVTKAYQKAPWRKPQTLRDTALAAAEQAHPWRIK